MNNLLVMIGPSGGGKTTIGKILENFGLSVWENSNIKFLNNDFKTLTKNDTILENFQKKDDWFKIVTTTTRKIRLNDGEVDGKSYYFKTKQEYDELNLILKTEYPKKSGNFYGIDPLEIENKLKKGNVYCILDIDGALELKEKYPHTNILFLYDSLDSLKQRLVERGDTPENIKIKLEGIINDGEYNNVKYADISIRNSKIEDVLHILNFYLNKN